MKIPSARPARKPGVVSLACVTLPVCVATAFSLMAPQPAFLWNPTPSEPVGLYVRSGEGPRRGRIIAFLTPDRAFPYADGHMNYLRRIPILKTIAAGEGDKVCTNEGVLTINGRRRGPVFTLDGRGAKLPLWRGCRKMVRDEFFVFSDRITNSFDSRYYGPVARASIIGVFRPLGIGSRAGQGA